VSVGADTDDAGVQLFAIYDRPADHPNHVVLRTWWVAPGPAVIPLGEALCDTLGEARAVMYAAGLVCLGRQDDDDPAIVETWV